MPGPRPFYLSKGHEALLGLTGKGKMAALNATYQMWCADERKIEHVFHFEISDFLPLGNPQDMTRFSQCKRFTVTCLFSEESFATQLQTRQDFMQAIYFLSHWIYQLPDTAEHIEIYFEHEKIGPGGVSIEPNYWGRFMGSYGLNLHTVLIDTFKNEFKRSPKMNHIKTLVISYGENFTLCPGGEISWRKDKKENRLMRVSNKLYPAQKIWLDKNPCHQIHAIGIWESGLVSAHGTGLGSPRILTKTSWS